MIELPLRSLQEIEDNPSTEDWDRLHRYASWMRGLDLDLDTEEISGDAFTLLVSNLPPDGVLFPNLEWLHWGVDRGGFPFAFRLFLSSHLQRVTLYDDPNLDPTLRLRTKALVQMVSVLPASLEQLSVLCGGGKANVSERPCLPLFVAVGHR